MDPVSLIESAEALGAKFGIGRGIHLGDTIIGFKGRVAFEAPAAEILLNAHRELEKLVLSARQARLKDSLAGPYGDLVHEGQHLDPVCRDIEAFFVSTQQRVTGEVHLLLRPGSVFVEAWLAVFADEGVEVPTANRPRNGPPRRRTASPRCWRCPDLLHARGPHRAGRLSVASQMRNVVVDKIASIAQACGLSHELRIATQDFPCEEGVVLWSRS